MKLIQQQWIQRQKILVIRIYNVIPLIRWWLEMIVDDIYNWVMGTVGKELGLELEFGIELSLELRNEIGNKFGLIINIKLG